MKRTWRVWLRDIRHSWKDRLCNVVARKMPKRLRYAIVLDIGIHHCGGSAHPTEVTPEVPFLKVLQRAYKEIR